MNVFQSLKAATTSLPAIPTSATALAARVTGLNRFGLSGFLSLELAPHENRRLMKDGFLDNHIVFTVTNWKAQQFAKATPIVYDIKDQKSWAKYKSLTPYQKANEYTLRQKSMEEIDDERDQMVHTLRFPNPEQSWSELAYAISVHYDNGNALIYGAGPDSGRNRGLFQELYILPTSIYSGEGPTTEGYTNFIDSTGVNAKVPGEKVLHLRRFNPNLEMDGSGLWGLSKLSSARRVLAKSTQAQEAEAELFLNRGARTIVFPKYYAGMEAVDPMQAAKAAEAMRLKLKQAGSGGIASNSVELGSISLGMTSDDLKLMESNALSERQICALWNVDAIAVFSGVTEASRANGDTAVRKSLIEGVLPDQNILAQKLNQWFVEPYNKVNNYRRHIEFNTDVYPQLQADKVEMTGWMGTIALTENERREAMGFGRIDLPEMDIPTLPTSRQPITDFATTDPALADPNKSGY